MGLKADFVRQITIIDLFQHTTVASQADWLGSSEVVDDRLKQAFARAGKQAHG
jgi:hypothetical protein